MALYSGKSHGNLLVLHGGAPSGEPEPGSIEAATHALIAISARCFCLFPQGDLCEVVVAALQEMEADPQFYAGLGSPLQSDGQVRVSAGLMEGRRQSFSGVINALEVKHPSRIALWLQGQKSRVITQPGVQQLARDLGLPAENLVTPARLADWEKRRTGGACDTVGCVVRSTAGELAAGTSTGGRAFEFPGRVTDCATVAGNYASHIAAISATGIGEEIIDDALAARLESRCRDGMSLVDATRKCLDEAVARQRSYGWIAVDREGYWVAAHATPAMSFVVRDETGLLKSS